jgi:hypothetical protein
MAVARAATQLRPWRHLASAELEVCADRVGEAAVAVIASATRDDL